MQTKTIPVILLIAIATIGAIGIGIGTSTQSAQAFFRDADDSHGTHDVNPDIGSHEQPPREHLSPHEQARFTIRYV
jgi:hypothetical protein